MRRNSMASWLSCALVTSACTLMIAGAPAKANDKHKKTNAARCVKYSQKTKDTSIDVRLTSSCDIDLECSVSWTLVCGDSKAKHKAGKVFPLLAGDNAAVSASASLCGDAGWSVRGIKWSCRSTDD